MLPATTWEKNNCLSSLVGIQSDPCLGDKATKPAFFIEQIDGVDISKLSQIAGPSDLSGVAYANRIIQGAAMEMIGDLELLINNGYSLAETVGEVCSNCDFTGVYVPGGGIKIINASLSTYSQIRLTSLKLRANASGNHVLKIDDGADPKFYPVTIEAGVVMPLTLNYITQQKTVYASLVDQSVGMAQISCPIKSGCGCGSKNPAKNLIQYSGMIGNLEASQQYGFIACANISCSLDILVCELIRQAPNLMGLTLLYKIGEKINNGSKLSLRNSRVAAQPDDIKDTETFRYMKLYQKRLVGTTQEKGIRSVVNEYLKRRSGDNCIKCSALYTTAGATG